MALSYLIVFLTSCEFFFFVFLFIFFHSFDRRIDCYKSGSSLGTYHKSDASISLSIPVNPDIYFSNVSVKRVNVE